MGTTDNLDKLDPVEQLFFFAETDGGCSIEEARTYYEMLKKKLTKQKEVLDGVLRDMEEEIVKAVVIERATCIELSRTSPTGIIAASRIKKRGGS